MISIEELIKFACERFRPPPRLRLSEWAEKYGILSAESSAEPGKWHNIPYQVGILDAITDPRVERVTVIKSARVGYTKIIGHGIGYFIHYDPCPIMVVQPTIEDAEGYSKEEISPMIRDTPVLSALVSEAKSKDSNNTILQKLFPGGSLSLVGANSPRGFRRVSRRVVIFDEVDGYPPSAGTEGDQIKLGIKRTEYYWNRKIVEGSTPTTKGISRIESSYEASDKRKYYVPCPTCGFKQVLKFPNLKWEDGNTESAHFVCESCQKPIEHRWKRWMVERGEWRAEAPFKSHAGFHIWAAYSYSPNSTWAHIAAEFLEAKKKGIEALKTFINTTLGEPWEEKGDAPDWKSIYDRRETYEKGTCPEGVLFLTAGVDVQDDRIEAEIVGWGRNKESWSIEYRVIPGKVTTTVPWDELSKLLDEQWPLVKNGLLLPIRKMAVDSSDNTQIVYGWCRKYSKDRVMAIKGRANQSTILAKPSPVDVTVRGKRYARGLWLWNVGVNIIKRELYGMLRLEKPIDGQPFPPGYCHYPEYGEEHFKQLTAEQLVRVMKRGYPHLEWQKTQERNEALDVRVYNRAAAEAVGIDRFKERHWAALEAELGVERRIEDPAPITEPHQPASRQIPTKDRDHKPKSNPFLKPGKRFL